MEKGTIFDLEENQGTWFPFFTSKFDLTNGEIIYDLPEEGAAEFCFRSPNPFWEEARKERKKESKMVVNPQTRQMERVSYDADLSVEAEIKQRDNSWDYVITGMKNARWKTDGPEIKCTRENKLKLLKNAQFLRYANHVLELILDTGTKQAEARAKN